MKDYGLNIFVGNMYSGLADGRIIKFTDDSITTVARLGSPPYDRCGKSISRLVELPFS